MVIYVLILALTYTLKDCIFNLKIKLYNQRQVFYMLIVENTEIIVDGEINFKEVQFHRY